MSTEQKPFDGFQIRAIAELPGNVPQRLGKMDYLITYTKGGNQSFTIRIPAENQTEATIQTAIKTDYKKRGNFIGMKFQ